MNNISWQQKKNELKQLIKLISDQYGGDEIEWLKKYAKDIISKYANELDVPIRCFESLIRMDAKKCKTELRESICGALGRSMDHNLI